MSYWTPTTQAYRIQLVHNGLKTKRFRLNGASLHLQKVIIWCAILAERGHKDTFNGGISSDFFVP